MLLAGEGRDFGASLDNLGTGVFRENGSMAPVDSPYSRGAEGERGREVEAERACTGWLSRPGLLGMLNGHCWCPEPRTGGA